MDNPDNYPSLFMRLRNAHFDSAHIFAHRRHMFAQQREIEKGPRCASPKTSNHVRSFGYASRDRYSRSLSWSKTSM